VAGVLSWGCAVLIFGSSRHIPVVFVGARSLRLVVLPYPSDLAQPHPIFVSHPQIFSWSTFSSPSIAAHRVTVVIPYHLFHYSLAYITAMASHIKGTRSKQTVITQVQVQGVPFTQILSTRWIPDPETELSPMHEILRKKRIANLDRKRRAKGVEGQTEGIHEELVPKSQTVEKPMEEYVSDLVDESCQKQPEDNWRKRTATKRKFKSAGMYPCLISKSEAQQKYKEQMP
jgi:hypothetical protein